MSNETIDFPGQYINEGIELSLGTQGKINLLPVFNSLQLFEDIFSNIMTGTATFVDSGNTFSSINFTGDDYITFSFRTPTFTEFAIKKSFYVTSVYNRTQGEGSTSEIFAIDFISIEAKKNKLTFISKKFSGSTDSIVKKVFTDYLETERILGQPNNKNGVSLPSQTLASKTTFVSPYWTPLKLINWVASRSFETTTSEPNFLFFESNKKFYFKSITALTQEYKQNNSVFSNYIFSPQNNVRVSEEEKRYNFSRPTLSRDFTLVTKMTPFKMFDVFKSHDSGHFASKIVNVDFTLKNMKESVFDYIDNFNRFNHLETENYPLFSTKVQREPAAYTSVFFKKFKSHIESTDSFTEKWALQRNSLIHDLFSFKHEIEVPGRTDIEVGNIINFLYPKTGISTNEQTEVMQYDKFVSGIYVITAISHNFTPSKHTMILEIAKDSSTIRVE